jgi:hypothetical protein
MHVLGSRRKLKAAILESWTAKARTVCWPGRTVLECQAPSYNRLCREVGGRPADLRMRPVKR